MCLMPRYPPFMSADFEPTHWLELPIECPRCGNHGAPDGAWEAHGSKPFRLMQEVVQTWEFAASRSGRTLLLIADTDTDKVYWESGIDLRIECTQCYGSFPIPEGAQVDFE
jgi:hypothetical protein